MKNFTIILFAALVGIACFQSTYSAEIETVEAAKPDDSNYIDFGDWQQWNDDFKNVRFSKDESERCFFQIQDIDGVWLNVQNEPFDNFDKGWHEVRTLLNETNQQSNRSNFYKVHITDTGTNCK